MNTKIRRAGCPHPTAKRILSLILSIAMIFTLTAGIDHSAYADVNQNQWGEWIYQDHNTGIHDENGDLIYDSSSVDIIGYCGNEKNLIIPNAINGRSVISIEGFENNCNINTVTIQSGIEIIDGFAFAGCSELTAVTIPSTVISIRYKAFSENPKLIEVFYNGTEEQWNNISISGQWYDDNDVLRNATIHYNYEQLENSQFIDLNGYEYYNDYVIYTSVNNSFLKGTNPPENNVFEPARAIDRAMMVTILYRMAGEPSANGGNPYTSSPFTDITNTSAYYYDAACWALENGVTTETTFKPFNNVTREQTATFLYRYARDNDTLGDADYKNVNLNAYHDGNSISHFAVDAMKWANYNGMITGTQQGYANPQGATQRIHATKILYGFGKTCNIGNFA